MDSICTYSFIFLFNHQGDGFYEKFEPLDGFDLICWSGGFYFRKVGLVQSMPFNSKL